MALKPAACGFYPLRKQKSNDSLTGRGPGRASASFTRALGAHLGAASRAVFAGHKRRGKRKPEYPRKPLVSLGGNAHRAAVQVMRDPPSR